MKLIVGLGNPGPKYEGTRHNIGFMVLEALGRRHRVRWRADHGLVAKAVIEDTECSLLRPMEFMNHSGAAVAALVQKKALAPQDVLIVCDDLDLPFEKLRLRASGSSGGHNGLKSIITALGSNEFSRLRMGIDSPASSDATVDYVLSKFTPAQSKTLPDFIHHALDCVTSWVTEGAQAAMNRFN